MKKKKKMLDQGSVSEESFYQSLQSYLGILSHCEGYKLGDKLAELSESSQRANDLAAQP